MKTNYIDGQWHAGSGKQIQATSPNTNDVIWQGKSADQDDVAKAIAAAKKAFKDWAKRPYAEREAFLKRYQEILKERQSELAEAIHQTVGKPLWEAKTEAGAMIAKVDLSISAYAERTGTKINSSGAMTTALTHRPHGVLVVLGPYNFPGHLPNGHIVPALLAGNTVVHKPSEFTPKVGELLFECLHQAGFPNGVVNLTQGEGETGMLLTQHPDIDGVLFTGSSRTGFLLHKQFAGQPQKMLALEMGGNNPLIVHDVNDVKAAVYNTIQSAYITSGQRCTCSRRLILLDNDEGHTFLTALADGIHGISANLPSQDPAAFMGPVVHNKIAGQLMAAQDDMLNNGAKALVKMERPEADFALLTPGLLDVSQVAGIPDEELFGPMLQVYWANDLDHAIELANETRYGLSAGMLTDNAQAWDTFYRDIRAGIVNRNRPLTGASGGAPFGGVGASGNHRPSAFYAADYCAYPVASVLSESAALPDDLGPGLML